MSIYDMSVQKTDGSSVSLGDYAGKVMVIVNTASGCGLAPQMEKLERLYQDYHDQGLEILAFPSDTFDQEPLEDSDLEKEYQTRFGISFPVFAKIKVNGEDASPLYTYLKAELAEEGEEDIAWNYAKFLVDREGNVVKRYSPQTAPEEMEGDIKEAL